MSAIEATDCIRYVDREKTRFLSVLFFMLAVVACMALSVAPAFAGKAATGEPLFYPCTSCHPVSLADEPGRELPNGFTSHQIALDGHASLGVGSAACLTCHDDASRDPGQLKLADGTLVDITGDVSQVCYRCHSAIYKEFVAGAHGAGRAKCSSAGCHDPHTPSYIFGGLLLPFIGTGFQAEVLPVMQPFQPLAGPVGYADYHDPPWLVQLTALGVLLAVGIAGTMIRGRSKQ